MDIENEIHALAGETIAIQWVLTQVLFELKSLGPQYSAAVLRGFDKALMGVENSAIKHGNQASPLHLTKAIKIIEDLRVASLGGKP